MRFWEWIMPKGRKKKTPAPQAPREEKMQVKHIEFGYTDGRKVTQLPGSGLFTVKNPVDRVIPPEGLVRIDLGVKCTSHALKVFPVKFLTDQGFEITEGTGVKDVGEQLAVIVKNKLKTPNLLAEGESVLRAFALDNREFSIVGG